MDFNWNRLKDEQVLELRNTQTQIEQWEKFKEDYSQLHKRLKDLPSEVSYDVMVPLGPLAFMPGRLVHTNEILVLLGENWFVEKSAKEACEVIDRRKSSIATTINGFREQKKLLESRLEFTSDIQKEASGADGIVDIREEYDADKEAAWRENRAQRKRGKQATASESPRMESEQPVDEDVKTAVEGSERGQEEADLMARLDELERQEEEMDELARMDELSDEGEPKSDNENNEPLPETNRRVKWKDQESPTLPEGEAIQATAGDIPTIHFTHTNVPPVPPSCDEVKTPADIYHHYRPTERTDENDTMQPKSILKERSKETTTSDSSQPVVKPPIKSISESAFSGSVVEHKSDEPIENQPKKRVSKFKQARQDKGQR